jgi:ABC-type Fe3+-hydroxamate transport system substrate-binding protein
MEMLVSLEPVQCCRQHRWTVRLFRLVLGKKEEAQVGEIFARKKDASKRAKELVSQYKAELEEIKRVCGKK